MTKTEIMKLAEFDISETIKFVDPLKEEIKQRTARYVHNKFLPLIEALAESNEKLVEALEFYSKANNYDVSISGQCEMFEDADNYPEKSRFGKAARRALAEHKERMEKLK